MPIAIHASRYTSVSKGEGRAAPASDGGREATPIVSPATVAAVAAAPMVTGQVVEARPAVVTGVTAVRPEFARALLSTTATQIARGAIKQLNEANAGVVDEAIKTITNRRIDAGRLMDYLERKVKIGQVLNELANDWEDETKEDFAEAFNMAANKLEVMDSTVSIAVLNDPDLDEELMAENLPEVSETDLMQNRRITWQYPPAGTSLTQSGVILVAVEHRDVAQAEKVLESIVGQLTSYQGFKLPKATITRLKRQVPGGQATRIRR
jgi:hypothetical protein